MSPSDKAPGHQDDGPKPAIGQGAGFSQPKTFAELFCARYGVKPKNYAQAVFRRTVYPRTLLAAPLLRLFYRDYFDSDFDFIDGTGRLRDPEHLVSEVSHFQRHIRNRGFLRHALQLRVSVWRMTRLVMTVMGDGSGAAGAEPGIGDSAKAKPPVRILCVDDDPTCRSFYAAVFARAGYPCECVNDGREASKLLAADPRRFGLVITDHDMPGMGGLDLIRRIQSEFSRVAVLVLSILPLMLSTE